MNNAIFLDRDGTINHEVDNLKDIRQLRLLPYVAEAIRELNKKFLVIIISNQPVIARGWITEVELESIHDELIKRLKKQGAHIDAVYFCPHHPQANLRRYRKDCPDRKPRPGLIFKAAKDFNIDLKKSFFIGDTTVDIQTAKNAGVKSILVKTGYGGKDGKFTITSDFTAKNLTVAVNHIIQTNLKIPVSSDLGIPVSVSPRRRRGLDRTREGLSLERETGYQKSSGLQTQALILAAGKGTRLYPLTKKMPKVMIEVLGKPLIEHHILLLKKNGIKEIFINLYSFPKRVIDYFGNGKKFSVKISYSREDRKNSYHGPLLLGSAGSLHNFKDQLRDDFFVLYGDVFIDVNLKKMLAFHRQKKSLFTLVVHKAKHPKDSDLLEISSKGKVIKWLKVPHGKTSGVNNAGLYIINTKVIEFLPKRVPYDFARDFIPLLLKKIPVYAYETNEVMMDMGTPERYNKLLKMLQKS